MTKAKKSYSTRQAAAKMPVSFRTLTAIEMPNGRTLWLWTDHDIANGRKVKAAQKPGPRAKR